MKIWLLHKISKILKKIRFFYVSAHKGLKYYDVHYLRHHTIWIPKVETKTIQMRPNLAGYTSRRGYSIFRGFFGARPLL